MSRRKAEHPFFAWASPAPSEHQLEWDRPGGEVEHAPSHFRNHQHPAACDINWSLTLNSSLLIFSWNLYLNHQFHPLENVESGAWTCVPPLTLPLRLLPSLGNFLNGGHARAVQATGRFSVGTISSSWLVRATDGWLFFKPFVVLCRRSFIALEKFFFFFFFYSHPASQSFHHLPLWVTHMIVDHASDRLKNGRLAFSAIEADFLALFLFFSFCCGLSLKDAGRQPPPQRVWHAFPCRLTWSQR